MSEIQLLAKQLEVTRISLGIIRNHSTITNAQPSAYNVGNHTGGVIQLLLLFFPKASTALVRVLAFHDYSEFATGDIVGSAKTKYPKLGDVVEEIEDLLEDEYKLMDGCELTDLEWLVHDIVDRAELLFWAFEQYDCGCRAPRFLNMMTRVTKKVFELFDEVAKPENGLKKRNHDYEKHLRKGVSNLKTILSSYVNQRSA